jgi:hypothetical protein
MHIVGTLVERDFIYGACALFNSLQAHGFRGKFVIGYRDKDAMPVGAVNSLEKSESDLDWMKLETPMHFANYKPWFMQSLFGVYKNADKVTYIDPDIVCLCPSSWLETWCESGPAVCADVNWMMPHNHPMRHEWLQLAALSPKRNLDIYYNSGFVSVRRSDIGFLALWSNILSSVGGKDNPLDGTGDTAEWRRGGRWLPFWSADQDALNLALMQWDGQLATFGADAMGFNGTGILPHALGADKPWRRKYLRNALAGRPPSQADKAFWTYISAPARPWSESRTFLTRLAISVSAAIGRFYRRR